MLLMKHLCQNKPLRVFWWNRTSSPGDFQIRMSAVLVQEQAGGMKNLKRSARHSGQAVGDNDDSTEHGLENPTQVRILENLLLA